MYDRLNHQEVPLWLKVGIAITALSTLTIAVSLSTFVAIITPTAQSLVTTTRGVFSGLDVDEINTAIRRLIKILDVVCDGLVDCE